MKNFILAITISLIIHLILFFSFHKTKTDSSYLKNNNTTKTKYTYIKLATLKQKKIKPIKQGIKKVIKKKIVKKKVIKKEYKKVQKKDIKPAKRKTVFKQKKKKKIIKKKKPIDLREKYLKLAKEQQEIKKLDRLTQEYLKLYGQEYFNLTSDAKQYLKENLNIIGQITQQYLRYPSLAIRTRQHGVNIVEFILKPNGDIEKLRILGSSSYGTLDRNTIKTIKIAYKDYPRPKKDTLVRIYVKYLLY